ncbi:hypothetical protein DLM78_19050 [Leptospira stimsonii]|uniref:Uncharacterized protein n=1 Tax=Leptospira stimsonii TaxID=2202203 RepID=A0A8B3CLQ7_9LEPT|nr:hypothetical protein DLM78_19050 [Leptospira stimsonii]
MRLSEGLGSFCGRLFIFDDSLRILSAKRTAGPFPEFQKYFLDKFSKTVLRYPKQKSDFVQLSKFSIDQNSYRNLGTLDTGKNHPCDLLVRKKGL